MEFLRRFEFSLAVPYLSNVRLVSPFYTVDIEGGIAKVRFFSVASDGDCIRIKPKMEEWKAIFKEINLHLFENGELSRKIKSKVVERIFEEVWEALFQEDLNISLPENISEIPTSELEHIEKPEPESAKEEVKREEEITIPETGKVEVEEVVEEKIPRGKSDGKDDSTFDVSEFIDIDIEEIPESGVEKTSKGEEAERVEEVLPLEEFAVNKEEKREERREGEGGDKSKPFRRRERKEESKQKEDIDIDISSYLS